MNHTRDVARDANRDPPLFRGEIFVSRGNKCLENASCRLKPLFFLQNPTLLRRRFSRGKLNKQKRGTQITGCTRVSQLKTLDIVTVFRNLLNIKNIHLHYFSKCSSLEVFGYM